MNAAQRNGLSDAALALTEPIIDDLISSICRRIRKAGGITDTAEYEIYRAQALGAAKKDIARAVARQLGIQQPVIDALFEYVLDTTLAFDDNGSLKQIAEGYARMTKDKTAEQLRDLWAAAPDGKVVPLQDAYKRSLDHAFRSVATGAADHETAIRQACAGLAERGLRTIEQKSGRSVGIEYAVRRYLMDQLGALDDEVTQANHDALGCDGWEISAHAGSAPDHEPYQGRQYSDADYKALNEKLQRRIGHLNCGHTASPIILGVNQPQYSEAELQAMKRQNEQGVVFEGRHYTLYEAGQKQSSLENGIRFIRRRILAAEESGDPKLESLQIRLKVTEGEYRRFCRATNQPTRTERLQVAGFGRSRANRAVWTYRKAKEAVPMQTLNFADDVPKVERESIEKELTRLPKEHREAAERQITRVRVVKGQEYSAYDPKTKEILLSDTRKAGDVIHEYGHALDRALKIYKDPTFRAIREDGLDLADSSKVVYDRGTYSEKVCLYLSEKFVTEYQGRIYEDLQDGIYLPGTNKINPDMMKEYFSEGYRAYFMEPENLKKRDPMLYEYIGGLLHDKG